MALNDSQINQSALNVAGNPVGRASAQFSIHAVVVGVAASSFTVDVQAKGVASAAFGLQASYLTGTARALFGISAAHVGRAAAGFSIESLYGRGRASAGFAVSAHAVGAVSAGFTLYVANPNFAPGEPPTPTQPDTIIRWTASVRLDENGASQYLTGVVTVEAEEGAARTASFKLLAEEVGGAPTDYLNQQVTIEYRVIEEEKETGVPVRTIVEERLFSGVVDHATFDPFEHTINFRCIDRLKLIVEQASREEIDTMLNDEGHWHPAIFREDSEGWEYAQEKLRTIGADLELSRHGHMRLNRWDISGPVLQYHRIIEDSLALRLSNVEEVLNTVRVQLDYRFTRLLERELVYSWRPSFNFCQFLGNQLQYPSLSMIRSAIDQTGWHEQRFEAVPVPPSGVYCGGAIWIISQTQQQETIQAVGFTLAHRFSRQLIERYAFEVAAGSSVGQYDELSETRSYTVETEFDDNPFLERSSHPDFPRQLENADFFRDELDRADLEKAFLTAGHLARTDIRASHRASTVTWRVPIEPQLERYNGASLAGPYGVLTSGKVRSFRHELDLESGEATTEISIALRIAGGGSDTTIEVPEWPEYGVEEPIDPERIEMPTQIGGNVASGPHDEEAQGFSGNHEPSFPGTIRYPYQFRVVTPEIPSATATEPDVVLEDSFFIELAGDNFSID